MADYPVALVSKLFPISCTQANCCKHLMGVSFVCIADLFPPLGLPWFVDSDGCK